MRKIHLLFGLGLLLPLTALAWWQGWFASEPVYHGRTVTQWLDAMAVYDDVRNWDLTPLSSLLALGPRAVPTLRAHLNEPPSAPSRSRQIVYWVQVNWDRLWDSSVFPYSPLTPRHTSRDEARSLSAGLVLLALGTNQGGGLPILIEEHAKAGLSTNLGSPQFSFYSVIDTAVTGLPERRSEMREAIDRALTHTNLLYRQFAAKNALARRFPEAFPDWRPLLIRLAGSDQEDPKVRDGAMFALLVRTPVEDQEFVVLCTQVFTNRANASLLRARATGGLRFGGSSNLVFLSLMRGATNDADGYVKQSARIALRDFEKHPPQ